MDIVERKGGDRRRLARLISKESDAMQRDRLRSVLMVLQGRQSLEVADVVGTQSQIRAALGVRLS